MESRPDPIGVFRSNTRTEPAPPVTGTGARWRARRRAAISTASTPIATCMSRKNRGAGGGNHFSHDGKRGVT